MYSEENIDDVVGQTLHKEITHGFNWSHSIARHRNTIIPAGKRHFQVGLKGTELKQNKRKLSYL